MKQKAFAIAGGILLGFVAVFTLISALKAAIGLAIIAFAGRGLMRLWMSGGATCKVGHHFQQHDAYPGLGNGTPALSRTKHTANSRTHDAAAKHHPYLVIIKTQIPKTKTNQNHVSESATANNTH